MTVAELIARLGCNLNDHEIRVRGTRLVVVGERGTIVDLIEIGDRHPDRPPRHLIRAEAKRLLDESRRLGRDTEGDLDALERRRP